jgi:hypothetical protein
MEIHTTQAVPALSRRCRLTVAEIGARAETACAELHMQAQARGLSVNGPPVFVARGMPQDAHTAFDIDFCLPVAGIDLPLLPALHCARQVYQGPLAGLFVHGYRPLLQAMAEAGLRPSGESREVYHAWHGPDSAANRIEIQIGIAA